MEPLREQRETDRTSGGTLARGLEMVATVVVFCLIGLLLDAWLGITPVLTIALGVFAVIGQFVRMWYVYDAEMRGHEARMRDQREIPA
ncbi:MAG TPA: AtpZ/AtpI family protein [Acidimicrobiales bacterium]